MKLLTKAPGKVMLGGEYSVLFGHKALVAAIDRYAHCSFMAQASFEFTLITYKTEKVNSNHLFHHVFTACLTEHITALPGQYQLDTSAFFSKQKIGLGSSAAAVVALCKAIFLQHNIDNKALLFKVAHRAHQSMNNGIGSSADIAASVYSDTIAYQPLNETPHITSIDISWLTPYLFIIDTKRAQNTASFATKVINLQQHQPQYVAEFCQTSSERCEQLVLTRELSKAVSLIDQLFHSLKVLGKRSGIDIISDEHQAIHDLAATCGGSAKPSGAGGGDIALALVPLHQQKHFLHKLSELHFDRVLLNLITTR